MVPPRNELRPGRPLSARPLARVRHRGAGATPSG